MPIRAHGTQQLEALTVLRSAFYTFTKRPNKRKASLFLSEDAGICRLTMNRQKGALLRTRQNSEKLEAFHTISLYADVPRSREQY